MTGRPRTLSDDQKTIAFRAEREVSDQLNVLAKEVGLTSSDLMRICLPILLKNIIPSVKKAKQEVDRLDGNEKLFDLENFGDVIKLCTKSTERQIRRAVMELIIAKRLEKAARGK